MKYVNEYRERAAVQDCVREILVETTRPWTLMEVCGGQTHSIVKYGLDELLKRKITFLHGPGCPVCVTSRGLIDQAVEIAARPEVIFCSFGDMLRVPGSGCSLLNVKAHGGDVRVVYSPLQAVQIARENPGKEVVFFAIGFETTAPADAAAVLAADHEGLHNFSLLVSHVLVPPALRAILHAPDCHADALLAAGHVCTVVGCGEYRKIADEFKLPIVVTGFEPLDILLGVLQCVRQLEAGRHELVNQYARCVREEGNAEALQAMRTAFRVVDRSWRGLGDIPASGLALREEFAGFDAELRFGVARGSRAEPAECLSSAVLRGAMKPYECPAFGSTCTPEHPLGAPMVSGEGACSAFFRYRLGCVGVLD